LKIKKNHILLVFKEVDRILANEEASAMLASLLDRVEKHYQDTNRVDSQLKSIYCFENSSHQIFLGISINPSKQILSLATDHNCDIANYFVSFPMKNSSIALDILKAHQSDHSSDLNSLKEEFIRRYGKSSINENFKLAINPSELYTKKVYASNGCTYKDIKAFAKAFDISVRLASSMLKSNQPYKGVSVSTKSFINDRASLPQPKTFTPNIIRRKKSDEVE
jgi:hypothetical protein